MTSSDQNSEWLQFNTETIDALLADGSHPERPHTIEYHIAGKTFANLEKAAVDIFKFGYEVTDAEELHLDDGSVIFSFDAIKEIPLDLEQINSDTEQLLAITKKHGLFYDGWGTYFVE